MRVEQRIGRIDRIGSQNKEIQLINFWPTPDLNKYINLKNRVEARMALVDIAGTNYDNLLKPEEIERATIGLPAKGMLLVGAPAEKKANPDPSSKASHGTSEASALGA